MMRKMQKKKNGYLVTGHKLIKYEPGVAIEHINVNEANDTVIFPLMAL